MTDRVCGILVTLTGNTRADDMESTLNAIRHIRGVVAVEPVISLCCSLSGFIPVWCGGR